VFFDILVSWARLATIQVGRLKMLKGIEDALLAMNPALSTGNYRVETRRVFVIEGVRHEVDVYVKVDLGSGYDTVVLFECKNWQHQSVGKNEVIVLSEKVKALSASKAYLVARGPRVSTLKTDSIAGRAI
jgi:hypothetical protein